MKNDNKSRRDPKKQGRNSFRHEGKKGSKRSDRRDDYKRDEDKITTDSGPNGNDVSWYANNPQLLVDSASLSYAWPIGAPVDYGFRDDYPTNDSIPGIMAIDVLPTIGGSNTINNGSSAINIAAKNIYSYVRHANSGHSNYDAPDLMMYLYAIGSIYAQLSNAARMYGVAQIYSQTNRYMPKALLTAMGVNAEGLFNNLANFRMRLNTLIAKVSSLVVPNDFPVFKRYIWMFGNYFSDNANMEKSQFYFFRLAGYYKFSFNAYETGGSLLLTMTPGLRDWNQILDEIEDCISVLIEDEDMNIMSGDLLKAFDKSVVMWAPISENFVVVPSYSPEVLTQINNTITVGPVAVGEEGVVANREFSDHGAGHIHQTPEGIIQQKIFTTGNTYLPAMKKLLNMPQPSPTAADTMVATRLMVGTEEANIQLGEGMYYDALFDYTGSEVAVRFIIHGFTYTHTGIQQLYSSQEYSDWAVGMDNGAPGRYTETANDCSARLAILSKFDFHPRKYNFNVNEEGTELKFAESVGDVHTMALVDAHTLAKMHNTALLSEWIVPQFGMFLGKK